MKEQSHKEEMSNALRGDFERLRERGVAATLAPRGDRATPPAPDTLPSDASAAEPASGPEPERPQHRDAEAPSPGWLGRLLGR